MAATNYGEVNKVNGSRPPGPNGFKGSQAAPAAAQSGAFGTGLAASSPLRAPSASGLAGSALQRPMTFQSDVFRDGSYTPAQMSSALTSADTSYGDSLFADTASDFARADNPIAGQSFEAFGSTGPDGESLKYANQADTRALAQAYKPPEEVAEKDGFFSSLESGDKVKLGLGVGTLALGIASYMQNKELIGEQLKGLKQNRRIAQERYATHKATRTNMDSLGWKQSQRS